MDKYLDRYEKLLHSHNLPQRQFRLEAQKTQEGVPLTPPQVQEAEAIDFLCTKFMNQAEHKCRKLKMGMVDFSPVVALRLKQIAF